MSELTPFRQVIVFLTKLAWNSRVTLPMLVAAAFMAMDCRLQLEINLQTLQEEVDSDTESDGTIDSDATVDELDDDDLLGDNGTEFSTDDDEDDNHHDEGHCETCNETAERRRENRRRRFDQFVQRQLRAQSIDRCEIDDLRDIGRDRKADDFLENDRDDVQRDKESQNDGESNSNQGSRK